MNPLSYQQNTELWRITILLLKADGREDNIPYSEVKHYMSLVDIDDIKKRFPDKSDIDDDNEYRIYATKIARMRRRWKILKKLTYREVYEHEIFDMCNSNAAWISTVVSDPKLFAYANSLVEERE